MNNRKVLVTYGWCRNAWAVARNLSNNGLEVHTADSWPVFMTRWSRYSAKSFLYPPFHSQPKQFIETIIDYIVKNDIGTYIPIHEETLVVARHIKSFPSHVRIPIAPIGVLETLHNKKASAEMAEQLEIPAPRTLRPKTYDDAQDIAIQCKGPWVIKLTDSNGSKGVRFAAGKEGVRRELRDLRSQFPSSAAPILQERVSGTMYAVSLIAHEGRIVTAFVRRNLREKDTFGGTCTKCESIHHGELVEQARKIVQHLSFSGPLMMEFLVDETTGRFWFIEANPRYWGTTPHDLDCGLELPFYQYSLANRLTFRLPEEYQDGIKSRWIIGDIISFTNTVFSKRPRRRQVKDYFVFDDDHYMDFKIDDPLAFLSEGLYYLSKFLVHRSTNPVEKGMIN